jgi:hypothetical protein
VSYAILTYAGRSCLGTHFIDKGAFLLVEKLSLERKLKEPLGDIGGLPAEIMVNKMISLWIFRDRIGWMTRVLNTGTKGVFVLYWLLEAEG